MVEVAPRDGFQSVGRIISTGKKLEVIRQLHAAGLRRIETTSFVSARAVPQMADAAQIAAATARMVGLDAQVLVPNAAHARRAMESGAEHFSCFLSASEPHNLANIKRTRAQSLADYAEIIALIPVSARVRFNVSTAFDCPFAGRVEAAEVIATIEAALTVRNDVEVALCDTTGRAEPAQVDSLFRQAATRFPGVRSWAFHAHDTYGLGCANAYAAYLAGVRVFDASVAGIGGCPFAPGATGNVATEDLAWMFDRMGVLHGLDWAALGRAGNVVAAIEGARSGGRVRVALAARERAMAEVAFQ